VLSASASDFDNGLDSRQDLVTKAQIEPFASSLQDGQAVRDVHHDVTAEIPGWRCQQLEVLQLDGNGAKVTLR
jgi:hypothetical protein